MKIKIGDKFRIGGKFGTIMIVSEIGTKNCDIVFVDESGQGTYYYSKGDCTIIPVKEVRYEQLKLF